MEYLIAEFMSIFGTPFDVFEYISTFHFAHRNLNLFRPSNEVFRQFSLELFSFFSIHSQLLPQLEREN